MLKGIRIRKGGKMEQKRSFDSGTEKSQGNSGGKLRNGLLTCCHDFIRVDKKGRLKVEGKEE